MTTADEPITIGMPDPFADVTDTELAGTRTAGASPLEQLQAELAKPAERVELLRKRIPLRPSVALVLDPNLVTSEIRQVWVDRAKRRSGNRAQRRSRMTGDDTPVDPFLFACLALAHTNVGVTLNGTDVPDLTLKDERLWGMVGAVDPEAAIRKLFGNDQHVEGMAGEVILASGIDDELEDEGVGPTRAS